MYSYLKYLNIFLCTNVTRVLVILIIATFNHEHEHLLI